MKIGILGSGEVARSLAAGFLDRSDDVMLGTREPEKLAPWVVEHPKARTGSFAEAASFGGVVVLALLGSAAVSVVEQAGAEAFEGKVVIDATNPLQFDERGPQLYVGFDDSLGEQVQRALPNAHVVKAFNTVGAPEMVRPSFDGGPPSMFVAGDDAGAKAMVDGILRDFGWDVVDLGGIASARYLEPMCMAWVVYGIGRNGWHHAFKMLR